MKEKKKRRKINYLLFMIMLLVMAQINVNSFSLSGVATNDYTKWKQTNNQWANATPLSRYGDNDPFGNWGCYITSVAILLRHYNVVTDSNVNSFNPIVCCNRLLDVGAVDRNGLLSPSKVKNAYPGFEYVGNMAYSEANIKSLFNRGYACVVAENGNTHYVAVKSVSNSSIVVMDPGSSSVSTVRNASGIHYFKITKKNSASSASSISISPTIAKTSMNIGETCIVGGSVSSSGSPISSVTAGIYCSPDTL